MGMDAQVLVFASQKGGSGKTTLSGHVAVAAEQAGAGPVALVDADPQGSLANWWNARASETPAFAHVSVHELGRDIDALKDAGFKLIVVDTPPAVTGSISDIVAFADLVIIPTRPSPHDLRAVGATVDIVEFQRKPLIFVVNAATARARITGETAVALSQHGTVAPVTVHQRVDFAASMIDGRTVGEVNPSSRSAGEITNLWEYLADKLARLRTPASDAVQPPRPTFENDIFRGSGDARQKSIIGEGRQAEGLPRDPNLPGQVAGATAAAPVPAPAQPGVPEPQGPAHSLLVQNGAGPSDDEFDIDETDDWSDFEPVGAGWDYAQRYRDKSGSAADMSDQRMHPVFGRRGNS